ncbi:MAG: sulfatase family protein [Chloroflexota bacterium]
MKRNLIFTACCLSGALISCNEKQPEKPNIIFIYGDDVGYGDLECYGATAVRTPNVNRLADRGIKFTNAYACAATSTPSRYALLTGEYAWRRNDTGIARGDAPMIIRKDQYTVASLLRDAGYNTAAVGKWHLGLGEGGFNNQDWNGQITPGPKEIGFDYSYIMAATGDRTPCVFIENAKVVGLDPADPIEVSYEKPFEGEPLGSTNPEMLTMHPSHGHDQAIVNGISRIGYMKGGKSALWKDENIADSIAAHAVRFIDKNSPEKTGKPFFLYLCTQDIHVPRVPHPRFNGATSMGPRGDAIAEFDWIVGQVYETLQKNGLTKNTIIILTSDNGPVVDDGYKDRAVELLGSHKPAGIYRGGKYSAFEAGTRVPFIVSWPARIKAAVSETLLSQVDFFGTMAALAGREIPENAAPDTRNSLGSWLGETEKGREYIVEQSIANALSIVSNNWKYITPSNAEKMNFNTNTELGHDTVPQLYDLSADPGEKTNLAEKFPERVKELSSLLGGIK